MISGPITGDFDLDGLVDDADRDVWLAQFGSVGPGLTADANRDNVVDAADITIWRDVIDAQASAVSAAAAEPVAAVESVTFDVDAFAPMVAPSATVASALDESLAVDTDPADADADVLGAALLEWSLEGPALDADEDPVVAAAEERR